MTEGKILEMNAEKSQQLENTIHRFESNEQNQLREYHAKIESLNEQKNKEINVRLN